MNSGGGSGDGPCEDALVICNNTAQDNFRDGVINCAGWGLGLAIPAPWLGLGIGIVCNIQNSNKYRKAKKGCRITWENCND